VNDIESFSLDNSFNHKIFLFRFKDNDICGGKKYGSCSWLGIEKNHTLIKLLSKLKTDFKVTYKESEILYSDKVILPNSSSISSAVKQLHLLNLFTMLRLCNKQMLGISVGMNLISAYTKGGNLSCRGIFAGTAERIDVEKWIGFRFKRSYFNKRTTILVFSFCRKNRVSRVHNV